MAVKIDNNPGGTIGKPYISVSQGKPPDDKVSELITALHVQIDELVRIFAETQRANRNFSADFADVRQWISRSTKATESVEQLQAQVVAEFATLRTQVQAGASNNARLNQLIQFIHQLANVMAQYAKNAGEQFATIEELINNHVKMLMVELAVHEGKMRSEFDGLQEHLDTLVTLISEKDERRHVFEQQRYEWEKESHHALVTVLSKMQEEQQQNIIMLADQIAIVRMIVNRSWWERVCLACRRFWNRLRSPGQE